MRSFCIPPHLVQALLLLGTFAGSLAGRRMSEIFGWKIVDFNFEGAGGREQAIRSGAFVPGNSLPLDVDAWKSRLFITLPKWKPGIPATLTTVSMKGNPWLRSPNLTPYPDWSWNKGDDCDGLISVFRMKVDSCGRLWVLDSGAVNILENRTNACPPKILVFDLATDTLLRRYTIPKNVIVEPVSLLITIAVDNRDCGDKAFAYLADVTGYGLIVYDYHQNKSWRVDHPYFYPDPLSGIITVAGESFPMMDGVFGLSLSPVTGGDRLLYFHSLASVRQSWVRTSVLKNETVANSDYWKYSISQPKMSQSAASATDRNGIMFFGLLERTSIACWNVRYPYTQYYIEEIDSNPVTLQFPSGVKVDNSRYQNLWVLTSRFQSYFRGTINNEDVNYRVLAASVREAIKGTVCDANDV